MTTEHDDPDDVGPQLLDVALRKRLVALCDIASPKRDSWKPALSTVRFDHNGAWATDSYALGHVPLTNLVGPSGHDRRNVDAPMLKRALKLATAKTDRLLLSLGADWATVTVTKQLSKVWDATGYTSEAPPTAETVITAHVPYAQVEFPDVYRLVGDRWDEHLQATDEDDPAAMMMNPALLNKVDALRNPESSWGLAFRQRPHPGGMTVGPESPVEVRDANGVFVGIVMPMRSGGVR